MNLLLSLSLIIFPLQITVGEVAMDFCVSPVLASILAPFQEHTSLTAEQLAGKVRWACWSPI
jgi:hypothetical protein